MLGTINGMTLGNLLICGTYIATLSSRSSLYPSPSPPTPWYLRRLILDTKVWVSNTSMSFQLDMSSGRHQLEIQKRIMFGYHSSKGKTSLFFHSFFSLRSSNFGHQLCGEIFLHQAILGHLLDVLQFNSIRSHRFRAQSLKTVPTSYGNWTSDCYLGFWPTGYKSGVPTTPSSGVIIF